MAAVRYSSELPRTADVVIIGAGIVGAASAFHAVRRGLSVVVLERRGAPATLTTPASTGAYRLQFDNLEELQLVRESVELFLNFAEVTAQDTYDIDLRQQGYLWATTDDGRAQEQRELVARQHGWGQTDIELLDGESAQQRFPYLSPEVRLARYRADDGFLDPRKLTLGLLAGAQCPVVVDCGARALRTAGEKVTGVTTERGPLSAGSVVVAAGPFSKTLCHWVGVDLPVEMVNRHKLVFPDVPEIPPDAPMTIDDDTGAHWRPALRGAYVLYTNPDTPPSPPLEAVPPDDGFVREVLDPERPSSVGRISPFWRTMWRDGGHIWLLHSGQYVVTPDHRPLIGPVGPGGLYVNTGYSGHGIMGSPAGSRTLLDVITGRVAAADNPFGVDRQMVPRARDVL